MKKGLSLATLLAALIVMTLFSACVMAARGAEVLSACGADDVAAELEKAKQRLSPAYTLAYKFTAGEKFRTKVVHLATVETKIKGAEQTTKSRTISTRAWRIKEVNPQGHITFENVVERVEMWNSVSGKEEVRYDSRTDENPPPGFETVAQSIGRVLATITIDPHGRILTRENAQLQFNPGIGELTIPFPATPVKPGASWSIPDELKMTTDDGKVKKVQTQQQYTLEKVETGVATIKVQTQILTPINDPKLQSQLVQRLQRGTIKFDLDAGRLIHKQMDIDEEVFAFSGADSHMQYLARLTEEPLKEETAAAPDAGQRK
ncbi:MAG TPA: DUF6263 family protein [Pirellulaceae bacterium]|nr:DUF6263 family protein [Pirellulaceae bacterium]